MAGPASPAAELGIPIKVISLARTPQRRDEFARYNGHLPHEFVEAVDGQALTEARRNDPLLFEQPLPRLTPGAYGCALSHVALWDLAIASGQPVTVAEDDAIFRHDFAARSSALIRELAPDWDLVMWGWNFDSILSVGDLAGVSPAVMVFSQPDLVANLDRFQRMDRAPFALRLDKCFGTPAYTISAAGARKYREQCFPMKHFELPFPLLNRAMPNTGIDIAMNRIYPTTQSFVAFPPLAATKNEGSRSTVQR